MTFNSSLQMEPMQIPLVQFVDQLTRIFIPIIIIVSAVSNLLNIVVLRQPALYQQACSRYFLANACSNLFYSSVILVYRLLADQYHIDPANISNVWCKIIVYINHVGIFLAPNFIVLASIDRWCVSSTNAQLRKFSNVKIARQMIIFTIVLFALIFINSAITVDLRNTDPFGCRIRADTIYKQVYVFFQACMASIIPSCLMICFGLLTIYHIKKTHVQPVTISRDRRTGNQLVRMLLLQVGTYIILTLPSSITYLIFVLPNDLKTTSSYLVASMILSAQIYRKEFIRLSTRIFRPNGRIQVHP